MTIRTYVSKRGDTADYIAWRFHGTTAGSAVEQMLEFNPGLADHGPILPAGVVVHLFPLLPTDEVGEAEGWD